MGVNYEREITSYVPDFRRAAKPGGVRLKVNAAMRAGLRGADNQVVASGGNDRAGNKDWILSHEPPARGVFGKLLPSQHLLRAKDPHALTLFVFFRRRRVAVFLA